MSSMVLSNPKGKGRGKKKRGGGKGRSKASKAKRGTSKPKSSHKKRGGKGKSYSVTVRSNPGALRILTPYAGPASESEKKAFGLMRLIDPKKVAGDLGGGLVRVLAKKPLGLAPALVRGMAGDGFVGRLLSAGVNLAQGAVAGAMGGPIGANAKIAADDAAATDLLRGVMPAVVQGIIFTDGELIADGVMTGQLRIEGGLSDGTLIGTDGLTQVEVAGNEVPAHFA